MKGVKERMTQTRELQRKVHLKRQELKTKIAQAEAAQTSSRATSRSQPNWGSTGWNQSPYSMFSQPTDPLEETFQRWETEEELEDLKRQMGR